MEFLEENQWTNLCRNLFGIDLIFTQITKHLDIQGLKNVRLVCSDWYKMSRYNWAKRACVSLSIYENMVMESDSKPTGMLCRFMDYVHNQDSLKIEPIRNFRLINCDFESQDFVKFFEVFGEQIHHLCLQFQFGGVYHDFEKPLFKDLGSNLTSLTLLFEVSCPQIFQEVISKGPIYQYIRKLEIVTQKPQIFGPRRFDFFTKFPALECYKFAQTPMYNDNIFVYLAMFRCFSKKRVLNLTELDITNSVLNNFNGLIDADFPLLKLALQVEITSSNKIQLEKVLTLYMGHLQKLKLVGSSLTLCFPLRNFPFNSELKYLTSLELLGNLVGNFHFLTKTPALQKLRMDLFCYEIIKDMYKISFLSKLLKEIRVNPIEVIGNETLVASNLVELIIDFHLSEECWKRLTKWMPNLRVLAAPHNNKTLEVVFCHWKDLRKLNLRFGSNVDDERITGLRNLPPNENCEHPLSNNITSLPYLESFELDVVCGLGKLTDNSATFGFLKLKYLTVLKLYVSSKLMSWKAEYALKSQIKVVQIYRECNNVSSRKKKLECCRWKQYMQI